MLDTLTNLDTVLFLLINVYFANPVTDVIMPIITSDDFLRLTYALALVLCLWRGDARLRWLVLFSLITLAVTDQLSSGLLKPYFARPRPCHVLQDIHLLVGCGGGLSMPSSHATNAFGQALLFGVVYRRIRWPLFWTASLIAVSRVFVGVHYPGDVLVGALLGGVVGIFFAEVAEYFNRRVVIHFGRRQTKEGKHSEGKDAQSSSAEKNEG